MESQGEAEVGCRCAVMLMLMEGQGEADWQGEREGESDAVYIARDCNPRGSDLSSVLTSPMPPCRRGSS